MDDQRCLTSGEPANARWWAAQALWVLIRIRIGIGTKQNRQRLILVPDHEP